MPPPVGRHQYFAEPDRFAYRPRYGDVPPPPAPGLFGLQGGSGKGAIEGALSQFMPMIAESLRESMGGYAFNFGSDMNVTSATFAREFLQQTNAARAKGAKADVPQITEVMRGVARLIGHEMKEDESGKMAFAPETEAAITRMSQFAGKNVLPLMAAMFPEQIDRASPQGSMAVAAASFVNYGRFMVDPATGKSLAADPDYAVRAFSPLVDPSNPGYRGPRGAMGLGAGRLAQIGGALHAQGMLGSGTDLLEANQATKALTGVDVGEQMKEVQSGRIQDQVSKYSRVVAAINDIFSEAGKPNAPMRELIEGLQTMTQGGLGAYDPNTLTRVVRTMHAATQLSGMSMQQLTGLAAESGDALGRHGGHRAMAGPMATYLAGLGKVYADAGFGGPTLEGLDRDALLSRQAERMAATQGSAQMNLLGALKTLGGYAAPDTPIAEIGRALAEGKDVVTLADGRVVDTKSATVPVLEGLMRESKLDPLSLGDQLQEANQNQAAMAADPEATRRLGNSMRAAEQKREFARLLGVRFGKYGPDAAARLMAAVEEEAKRDKDDDGKDMTDQALAKGAVRRAGFTGPEAGAMAAQLGAGLGRLGTLTDLKTGVAVFRTANLTAEGGAADAEALRYARQGADSDALARLQRGGLARHATQMLTEVGKTGVVDPMNMAARVLGMVLKTEVEEARRTYDWGSRLTGPERDGAFDKVTGWRRSDLAGGAGASRSPAGPPASPFVPAPVVDGDAAPGSAGAGGAGPYRTAPSRPVTFTPAVPVVPGMPAVPIPMPDPTATPPASGMGGGFRPGGPMPKSSDAGPSMFDRAQSGVEDTRERYDRAASGGGLVAAAAGWTGAFKAAADARPTVFDMKATIAKLEIVGFPGVFSGRLETGGTMDGGATAVPPGAPAEAPSPRPA